MDSLEARKGRWYTAVQSSQLESRKESLHLLTKILGSSDIFEMITRNVILWLVEPALVLPLLSV